MSSVALAQDKSEIQKLEDKLGAAINGGDAKGGAAAFYTDDAIILPPGAEMITGKAEIVSFWGNAGQGIKDLKVTTADVKPLGNSAAREIGTFSFKTGGQTTQEVTGKYVVVWQKVGNDWKAITDIWNTNK
jgi:uncharacterized protein (TIGR02246 family)